MKSFNGSLNNQFGKAESKVPATVTIIILAISAILSWKLIPAKVRNMKFEQQIQDVLNINYAKEYKDIVRGTFNEYTMRDDILRLAQKLRIPIKEPEKQIVVEKKNELYTVTINYTEEINIPIAGIHRWDFHIYQQQDPQSGKAVVSKKNL